MMRNCRKILIFLAIAVWQLLFCITTFANNNVPEIFMDVLIHDDGSATITQRWKGSFYEGTENYIPIEDKSLTISNFRVEMNGKQFEYVDKWNVNGSYENKKYKCGINKISTGVELCFGISEYGDSTYTFSYDLSPLAKSYTDYDGFNFMFLNPDMSIYPSDMKMTIRLEYGKSLSEENARVWGFGYNGDAWFQDGQVISYTSTKLYENNSVIIMLRLDKGLITPSYATGAEFGAVQSEAFKGSAYERTQKEDRQFLMVFFTILALVIGIPLIKLILSIIRYFKLKKFYNDTNYFRDTPNGGDMAMSHALFTDFDLWNSKESNVIGALIMKMINDKNLVALEEKSIGFFGTEKVNTSLKLATEPTETTTWKLYNLIRNAAGEDGILQENELKKYATIHYNELYNFLSSIEGNGRNHLNEKNGYKKILGKNLKDLSDVGQKELSEVYGLRKFLDEFTMINEREVGEVVIWENLLIYATLFGIAKKVLKQLKKVYPDKIVELQNYSNTVYISDAYFRALYFSSVNARNAANLAKAATRAASGLGGHVSLGGGGGFSGGGHGGGSR